MYESFYGFREKPFQIAPNPEFLYKSPKHEAALAYLEYGVTENVGFILLTGEIGSGKTTLVQYILSRLGPDTEAVVVFQTNVTAEEMLGLILEEFDIPKSTGDKASKLSALNQCLIDRYARRKRVVLVIDEAQNLSADVLEEVRMISNIQADGQPLLQIMLVGQPELVSKLSSPSLRQFTQRIAASYHLTGLNREETRAYISHRLLKAGGEPGLFTEAAVGRIFELSGGIPRSINLLCQAALVYGFAADARVISQDIIRAIEADNVGIALPAAVTPAPPAPATPAPFVDGDGALGKRLGELESQVRDLQRVMDDTLKRLEHYRCKAEEEPLLRLQALLGEERKRNDELLKRCLKLDMENRYLRTHHSSRKQENPDD